MNYPECKSDISVIAQYYDFQKISCSFSNAKFFRTFAASSRNLVQRLTEIPTVAINFIRKKVK